MDEAVDAAALLTTVLVPLASRGVRLVLGMRRNLIRFADDPGLVIDLDAERYRDSHTLVQYVESLLLASKEPGVKTPYQGIGGDSRAVSPMARAISSSAIARDQGAESFLIARLLALSVRSRPTVGTDGRPAARARGKCRRSLR